MSLKFMLLGMLSYGPDSGYSLQKRFLVPGRPKLSQVYRTLKEMTAEGLITGTREQQEKLPARNLYGLTRKGQAEFQRWMASPWNVAPVKERLLLKLAFSAQGKKKSVIAGMNAFIAAKKDELAYYRSAAKELIEKQAEGRDKLDKFYWELVVDFMERRCRAELEWAEQSLAKIVDDSPPEADAHAAPKQARKGRAAGS
jgi:PadR family transcriptional regulator, regulatory protein AphA